ncbi:hypothetical protein ABBQ32_000139 [Trebouxia sp. C0010 RCD-2024]
MPCLTPLGPPCAGQGFQPPRAMARRSRATGALLCASTPAEARAARADQPIPTQTNGLVQTVVAAATSMLRLGQIGKPVEMVQQPLVDRLPCGDVPGIMACITEDFHQRAYFITGDISEKIYDSQCFFADPTVKFSGLTKWKGNLKLLVPFLIKPKIQLLNLEQAAQDPSVLHVRSITLISAAPWSNGHMPYAAHMHLHPANCLLKAKFMLKTPCRCCKVYPCRHSGHCKHL